MYQTARPQDEGGPSSGRIATFSPLMHNVCLDFYKQAVFDLRHIEVCALDEADRMFDLGFIADIRYMLRKMPT